MNKMFYSAIFLLTILCAYAAAAQQKIIYRPDGKTLTAASIDADVKKLMDTAEVTGLCLGIINDNKPVYVKGYGYNNKATHQLNDTATCFYAASLAKPLFAYLVMQIVDKGVINLDKPLFTYLPKPLPEYENYKDLSGDDRWKLITARHCLDHTTGFPNWRQLNPHNNQKLEIFFTPGEKYAYSGEGIYLLQFVLETVTNRQLEDLAQENIFKPFGMTRTSFVWQPSFEDNYAVGHNTSEDILPKDRRTSANAAGSMETTIADYTRFVASVMRGERLKKKSQQEMLAPQICIYTKRQFPSLNNDTTSVNRKIQLSYGLGWGLFNSPYGWVFFKEGHTDGWEHYTITFQDKRTAIIIMTNSSNGESIFKELVENISGVTIPWEWEGYTPYQASVKLPVGTLATYVGKYSLVTDPKTTFTITLDKGSLIAKLTEQQSAKLLFHSDTKFSFEGAGGVVDEFVIENGEVAKLICNEYGYAEWKKIK
jgi:CubicO group peptidase (beta-lactamase class C family)